MWGMGFVESATQARPAHDVSHVGHGFRRKRDPGEARARRSPCRAWVPRQRATSPTGIELSLDPVVIAPSRWARISTRGRWWSVLRAEAPARARRAVAPVLAATGPT